MYTTTEAAAYLKLSEHTVRKYVERGLIVAKKIGHLNLVTKSECDRYKRERKPRGNPNMVKNTAKTRK